ERLERIPAGARTRAEYTEAMDGFRAIYHQTPGDTYAAAAVNAVAELLTEQGRGSHDAKSLKDAVGQYEFLRKQYPGSSLRVAALLAEAQIYENDLHDAAGARGQYALLVRLYPKAEQSEEARAGLASLKGGDQGSGNREQEGSEQVAVNRSDRSSSATAFAPMPVTKRKTAIPDSPADAAPTPVKKAEGDSSNPVETAGPAHVAPVAANRHGR